MPSGLFVFKLEWQKMTLTVSGGSDRGMRGKAMEMHLQIATKTIMSQETDNQRQMILPSMSEVKGGTCDFNITAAFAPN